MARPIRRIAVNTGGGDAPGLNAVIRAVTVSALRRGWEVLGIHKGYEGLIDTQQVIPLTREKVRGITHLGGTILGTTNKGNPFHRAVQQPDGSMVEQDISGLVMDNFRKLELDAMIAIGGDGSLSIAHHFQQMGMPVVGVPKTIDNDLSETVITFGFDTAVTVATEALDRLHTTTESHERVMVVEVMGRYAGWIALNAGVASSCDVILIPEIPFDIDAVCGKVREREANGRKFSMCVVAEGAKPAGGEMVTQGPKEAGREVRLGGIADRVAAEIQWRTGKETRVCVLGHLQRGGCPTTFDRLLALRFGAAAVRVLAAGETGVMVALDPPCVKTVPLSDAIARMKTVPPDCDTIQTARDLGICLGDS
ncbi:MAG: 6-phosphofructokinase [Pirellulales bacterium]